MIGGSITDPAGDRLEIPPGAAVEGLNISLTPVSGQGPVQPFPLGWTPLRVVHVEVDQALATPLGLTLGDSGESAAGLAAVLARFDADAATFIGADTGSDTGAWVMVAEATIDSDASAGPLHLTQAGQYALLVADTDSDGPATPVPGQALAAAPAVELSFDVYAVGQVVPSEGRADDPTPALATVTVTADSPLRSGTRLRGEFMELIYLRDGSSAAAPLTGQDLIAYRSLAETGGNILQADFPITASRTFALTEISADSITVDLAASALTGRSLIGAAGGGVAVAAGRLNVPASALTGDTPISVRGLSEAAFTAQAA